MTQALASRLATALADGRRIVNRGNGGQTSMEIAGRQGGLPVQARLVGERIPASGDVAVSFVAPSPPIAKWAAVGVPVTIAGVQGLLKPVVASKETRHRPLGYTFTRSTPGAIVAAPGNQLVSPHLTDEQNGNSLNSYASILWLGRNGVGSSLHTDVTVYRRMLEIITTDRVMILPVFNGARSESLGRSPCRTVMARNAAVAAAFPQQFFDARRAFIDGAEAWFRTRYPAEYARDWPAKFPERSPDNLGTGSAWDIANDLPPRALRKDWIHLNEFGNEFIAELLAAEVKRRGW
jgi:hypothetical protein